MSRPKGYTVAGSIKERWKAQRTPRCKLATFRQRLRIKDGSDHRLSRVKVPPKTYRYIPDRGPLGPSSDRITPAPVSASEVNQTACVFLQLRRTTP